jgi:N6-adenosine-specific RNA methylase IME4
VTRSKAIARSLEDLAAVAREENAQAEADYLSALQHAIRAGEALIEAKSQLQHGAWLPWLATNVDYNARHAQKLMEVAANAPALAHLPAGTGLTGALKQLNAGKKPKPKPRPKPVNGLFSTIVIDPPWDEGGLPYTVIKDEGMVNFRINEDPDGHPLCAADDAHLYLWATHRTSLRGGTDGQSLALELIRAWGFVPRVTLTWFKEHGRPSTPFIMDTEPVIFATRGSLGYPDDLKYYFRLAFREERNEHSRKPESIWDIVRSISPEPRIDIFSRNKSRRGFAVCWGDESLFEDDQACVSRSVRSAEETSGTRWPAAP